MAQPKSSLLQDCS